MGRTSSIPSRPSSLPLTGNSSLLSPFSIYQSLLDMLGRSKSLKKKASSSDMLSTPTEELPAARPEDEKEPLHAPTGLVNDGEFESYTWKRRRRCRGVSQDG